jgi:hypothetical protein
VLIIIERNVAKAYPPVADTKPVVGKWMAIKSFAGWPRNFGKRTRQFLLRKLLHALEKPIRHLCNTISKNVMPGWDFKSFVALRARHEAGIGPALTAEGAMAAIIAHSVARQGAHGLAGVDLHCGGHIQIFPLRCAWSQACSEGRGLIAPAGRGGLATIRTFANQA